MTYKKCLGKLALFSVEKRRLMQDMKTVLQCMKSCYKENADHLFSILIFFSLHEVMKS